MTKESDIVYETRNFYLATTKQGLEVRLLGITFSVVVGTPADEAQGRRFIDRCEANPANVKGVRDMYRHWVPPGWNKGKEADNGEEKPPVRPRPAMCRAGRPVVRPKRRAKGDGR